MGKHHSLGGSNTYTWLYCPGSRNAINAAIQAGLIPEESPTNVYTEEGTVAHALGEICLTYDYEPDMFYNKTIPEVIGKAKTKKFLNQAELEHVNVSKEVMNEEYIEAVQVYVDHVRSLMDRFKNPELYLERSYSLEDYVDDDCGGSADATVIEMNGVLEIVDYKHGKGVVVEHIDNPQTKLYALGAVLELKKKFNPVLINMTIVQPRVHHVSGKVRTAGTNVNNLLKWGEEVVKPAVELLNEDNPELIPGEKQCLWCRVNGICKANAEHSLAIAKKEFSDLEVPTDELMEPEKLTLDEVTLILQNKNRIEKWLAAVATYAERAVESGHEEIEGFKLVERISNRKYKSEKSLLRRINRKFPKLDPYEKKLLSPAQLEILLKKEAGLKAKEAKELVDNFCTREKIGVALAPDTDGRQAIEPPIKTEFAEFVGKDE